MSSHYRELDHNLFSYSNNPEEKFRNKFCVINIFCKRCKFSWCDRIYRHKRYGCEKCDGTYEDFLQEKRKRYKKLMYLLAKKNNKCSARPDKKFYKDQMSDIISDFSKIKIIEPEPSFEESFDMLKLF